MAHLDSHELLCRIERLERKNRNLTRLATLACALPLLAGVVGWQASRTQSFDLLRVKRLEVMDERGVPMVVLAPDRLAQGGEITLRDRNGERRSWWQASPEASAFAMTSEPDREGRTTTLGFGIGTHRAQMSLIGPDGAQVSATVERNEPRVDLTAPNGSSLFAAPWKR
jgi:hypothetical protein